MTLVSDKSGPAPAKVSVTLPQGIPPEAEFILSALEVGMHGGQSRRRLPRRTYRVPASLRLFSDPPNAAPWTLYVRDVNPQGLGFVTRHRLPLGYGGILTIASPKGRPIRIDCTLLRCREAVQGWFEGSLYFNREQGVFELANLASD
jgi:hypothetical protein